MSASSSVPRNSAGRFAHIDAMRALAVMIVVVAHAGLGHIIPGGSGVTIFFSISGFIITYLLLRERDRTGGFSLKGFYLRRAIKIGPPLFISVLVPSVIFSFFRELDWPAFLGQIFFVFNWFKIEGNHVVMPGTDVVWSLSIEEQFYILFALFWLLASKSRFWRVATTSIALLCILWSTTGRILLASDPAMTHRIYYGSDTRIDGIAFGILTAVAYHLWQERGARPNHIASFLGRDWTLVVATIFYVASLVIRDESFRDTFRFTLQSMAACTVIIYGLMPGNGPIRKLFHLVSGWGVVQLLGLASYSIYLVHLSITNAIHSLFRLPLILDVTLISLSAVLTGIALYKFVEVPIHSARNRKRASDLPGTDVTSNHKIT